jgi:hypothetical protein
MGHLDPLTAMFIIIAAVAVSQVAFYLVLRLT